jgi:hypothetical protein
MKKVLFIILLIVLATITIGAFTQFEAIQGVVKDKQDQPMKDVTIIVAGTATGTVTDKNGRYALLVQDTTALVLEFSFKGCTTKKEPVNGRETVDVELECE